VPPEDPSSIADVLLLYNDSPSIFIDKSKKSSAHINNLGAKEMANKYYRILVLEP
jgi:hypothetical protein